MNSLKFYIDKLKNNGLKATKERIEMIKLFCDNPSEHFSIDEIEKTCSDMGIATIYRNIKNFKKCRIIDKVSTSEGDNFYTLCKDSSQSRTYLICADCGRIIDYSSSELVHIIDKIKVKYDFDVDNICCEIYGYCDECRRSQDFRMMCGGI